jgi:hypothetical protein
MVASVFISALLMASCTSESEPTSTQSDTTNEPLTFSTGIQGTMTRSGDDLVGDALEGQVLVWAASEDEPSASTTGITLFGRPREAVPISDGEFAAELGPGLYRLRGTAFGGEVCGEFVVEVRPNEVTQADFVCGS